MFPHCWKCKDYPICNKYNIKKDGENWIQDTTGAINPCAFSSTNYWWDSTNSKMIDANLNTCPLNGATSIITDAKAYGTKVGGTGRLMTLEEVEDLGGSTSDWSTSGCPTWINKVDENKKLNFWLGSADSNFCVWVVFGGNSFLYGDDYDDYDDGFGVRPVIEISKSKI